jgi:hypothetical protein
MDSLLWLIGVISCLVGILVANIARYTLKNLWEYIYKNKPQLYDSLFAKRELLGIKYTSPRGWRIYTYVFTSNPQDDKQIQHYKKRILTLQIIFLACFLIVLWTFNI